MHLPVGFYTKFDTYNILLNLNLTTFVAPGEVLTTTSAEYEDTFSITELLPYNVSRLGDFLNKNIQKDLPSYNLRIKHRTRRSIISTPQS